MGQYFGGAVAPSWRCHWFFYYSFYVFYKKKVLSHFALFIYIFGFIVIRCLIKLNMNTNENNLDINMNNADTRARWFELNTFGRIFETHTFMSSSACFFT